MRTTFVLIKERYEKLSQLPKQDLHELNWPLQDTVNLGVASVIKTVTRSRRHRGRQAAECSWAVRVVGWQTVVAGWHLSASGTF